MYLKRIATPKEWPILRKEKKYVVSESYDLKRALPLGFILRDMLGLGTNMREIKKILNQGKIEIDGKKVYNLKYPVTIFNIIKTSDGKKYKLEIKNRKFKIEESKEDKVPLRVIGKKTIEKGKIQLNLVSGKNVLTNRKDIKINDSIVLEGNKIAKHFPLKKGCIIKIISGKYAGLNGKIIDIERKDAIIEIDKEKRKLPLWRLIVENE